MERRKNFFSFMKEKVEMIQINLDYAFQKENDSYYPLSVIRMTAEI